MNKGLFAALILLTGIAFLAVQPAWAVVPPVKIRVAQYSESFDFVMPDGGEWQSGKKSGKIEADRAYQVIGNMTTTSYRKYHLMVGSAGAGKEQLLTEIENRFPGMPTHRFMAGAAPATGFPDNRVVFVGVGIFAEELQARELQDKLSADNLSSWIFIENIKPSQGNLRLMLGKKVVFAGNAGLQFKPASHIILRKAEFAKGYSWHGFEDRKFAGTMLVTWGVDDLIDCIEKTDLEKLLIGIVPSEISAKAPAAAMQAQAVAARGEMLSKKGVRHLNEGYDFCSEQHCQVYKGIQATDKAITSSIRPTFGLLLQNNENLILDAVYGANCGGHSSANHSIWTSNPDPHLQGISDIVAPVQIDLTKEAAAERFITNPPDCWCSVAKVEGADKFRWKKSLTATDWQKVEEKAAVGRIKEIGSFVREISGRIISLKVTGMAGEKTILKELPIRQLLGGLRSSFFKVLWQRDSAGYITGGEFDGAGWGHGVGMCQTGAQSMALAGKTFTVILEHYFPGAKMLKLY